MFHAGVRAVVEGQIEETSAANINRFKRDRSRAPNRSSLSELFISFLAKVAPFAMIFTLRSNLSLWVGHNLKVSLVIKIGHYNNGVVRGLSLWGCPIDMYNEANSFLDGPFKLSSMWGV